MLYHCFTKQRNAQVNQQLCYIWLHFWLQRRVSGWKTQKKNPYTVYAEAAVHGALCRILLEGRIILNARNLKFWTTSKERILSEITSDNLLQLRNQIFTDFFLKGWHLNCRFWRDQRWVMGSGNVYEWNDGLWYCIDSETCQCPLSWSFCLSCHTEHVWKMNAIIWQWGL